MQVKSIAKCSKGSILQYFRSALSYQLSLRPSFRLILSGRLRQVWLLSMRLKKLHKSASPTELYKLSFIPFVIAISLMVYPSLSLTDRTLNREVCNLFSVFSFLILGITLANFPWIGCDSSLKWKQQRFQDQTCLCTLMTISLGQGEQIRP